MNILSSKVFLSIFGAVLFVIMGYYFYTIYQKNQARRLEMIAHPRGVVESSQTSFSENTDKWHLYSNSDLGFTFKYPEKWDMRIEEDTDDILTFRLEGYKEDGQKGEILLRVREGPNLLYQEVERDNYIVLDGKLFYLYIKMDQEVTVAITQKDNRQFVYEIKNEIGVSKSSEEILSTFTFEY